jgi:hypothetical protein
VGDGSRAGGLEIAGGGKQTAAREEQMPDLSPAEVQVFLAAHGLSPLDAEDREEIAHRINAIHEALAALEPPGLDEYEPTAIVTDEGREP